MPTMQPITSPQDIDAVAALAHEIWNQHFTPIIGQEQVDYMLGMFQSTPAITRQIEEEDYEYYLVVDEDESVGYFALTADEESGSMQLSKIYLKSSNRGRGLGEAVLAFIEEECVARGIQELWLTVNKNNADSIAFYQRFGFVIDEPIVMDIGNGFVMDDYRMVKRVPTTAATRALRKGPGR